MFPEDLVSRLTADDRLWYDKGVSPTARDAGYHCGDLWDYVLCRVVDGGNASIDDAEVQHVQDRGRVELRVVNEDNKRKKFRFSVRCERATDLQFDLADGAREITLLPNPPDAKQLRATSHEVWFDVLADARPAIWTEKGSRFVQVSFKARRTPERHMKKTVLELDLAGYSDVARTLEENLSASEVATLNDQIQSFVDHGLGVVGLSRTQAVQATTGDGAILLFDHPEQAHHFARAVFDAAATHNADKTLPSAQRWFRMGAATGDIALRPGKMPGGKSEMAGTTIANAVRFEAAARVGQFVIDIATYAALPPALQVLYGAEETVKGKRNETFKVRRCAMAAGPTEQLHEPTPQQCLDLFRKLNPDSQIRRVMNLMEMKSEHQPAANASSGALFDSALAWAKKNHGGLKLFHDKLTEVIEHQ